MKTQVASRVLMYEGPFGPMLRRLKRVSIFSCVSTCISIPLLSIYGNQDMSFTQRASVGVAAMFFAVGTTATLRWVSKPYVWKMFQLAENGATRTKPLEVQTISLLGRIKTTRIENGLLDIRPASERMFSNVGVSSGENLYLHEERDCFADDTFHQELTKRANIKVEK